MVQGDAATARARLDKWLWAARFFKTRSQATEAVNGGKVHVNAGRAKAGHGVKVGDGLRIRKAGQTFEVEVLGLSETRGPASRAQQLYRETEHSAVARAREADTRRQTRHSIPTPAGQPDKRAQRELRRFKRGD